MNPAHFHLLINHLPLFASLLGAFVLAHGLWTRNHQTKRVAFYILIMASAGAGIAYLSGEPAEESVEHLQGISESQIEQHEDFAVFALVSLLILGLSALAGIYLSLKKAVTARLVGFITLALALVSFALVVRTGYLGGKIMHEEISQTTPPADLQEEEEDDD